MNASLVSARKLRRKLIKHLQQQQALDSAQAALLKQYFTDGHRRYLKAVGSYIAQADFTSERNEFLRTLCSEVTVEEFNSLQEQRQQTQACILLAQKELKKAEAAYSSVAPLGVTVSGWFSNDEEKAEIRRRKREKDKCESTLSQHQLTLAQLENSLSAMCDFYLRASTTPHGLGMFTTVSPIREQVARILSDMSRDVSSTWNSLSSQQTESLIAMEQRILELRHIYGNSHDTGHMLGSGKESSYAENH